MRKVPPVPVPTGQHYCFVCESLLPDADFYTRKGKPCSPCRPCTKSAPARAAKFIKDFEDQRAEWQAYRATLPPPPPPIIREFEPMDGFALWLEREAKKPKNKRMPRNIGVVHATPATT